MTIDGESGALRERGTFCRIGEQREEREIGEDEIGDGVVDDALVEDDGAQSGSDVCAEQVPPSDGEERVEASAARGSQSRAGKWDAGARVLFDEVEEVFASRRTDDADGISGGALERGAKLARGERGSPTW